MTININRGLCMLFCNSNVDTPYRPRLMRITKSLLSVDYPHRYLLHKMVSRHWYINVLRGLPTSSVSYAQHPVYIGYVLPALFVACTHRFPDVGQRGVESPKAYMHLKWHVRIWKGTSSNGMRPNTRTASTNVEYVYLPRNVRKRHVASVKACMQ